MKEKRLAKVETHLNSTLCLYSQRYLYPCGRKLLLYRPYFTLQHKTKKLLVRKKKKKVLSRKSNLLCNIFHKRLTSKAVSSHNMNRYWHHFFFTIINNDFGKHFIGIIKKNIVESFFKYFIKIVSKLNFFFLWKWC